MATKVRTGDAAVAANKVAGQSPAPPEVGHSLSPDLDRELYGLISRVIKSANVDAVAGEIGVDRSTMWKWGKRPGRLYAGAIFRLSESDPDLEILQRIGHCFLAESARRATARKAHEEQVRQMAFGQGGAGEHYA